MNLDDFEELMEKMPKSPVTWLGMGLANLQVAFELQMLQSAKLGVWSNFLRTKKCDPVQHMDSLLDAWDCLADAHVQNCAVVLACGCHIANQWDEWAFDPCDEHIEALDGRDPIDFWIKETDAGREHVTHPTTLPVTYHKSYIEPPKSEVKKLLRDEYSGEIKVGRQYVHMNKPYKDKHDSLIAKRLVKSVDDA